MTDEHTKSPFQSFSEVAPTETGRTASVAAAWFGAQGSSMLPGVLLMLFGLVAFPLGLYGLAAGGALVIAAIAMMVSGGKSNDAVRKRQEAGGQFLEASYGALLTLAAKELSHSFELVADIAGPVETFVVFHGGSTPRHADSSNFGFLPPVFQRPSHLAATGYILSDRGIAVVPAESMDIVDQSTGVFGRLKQAALQSAIRSPTVDLHLLAQALASHGDLRNGGKSVTKDATGCSTREIYFSEIVNIDASASQGDAGYLEVTTRDGRRLRLRATAELTKAVRDRVRDAKSTSAPSTKQDAEPQDASKVCPMCAESVKAAARVCRFCRHEFVA